MDAHRGHSRSLDLELLPERLGEPAHRKLRGGVGRQPGMATRPNTLDRLTISPSPFRSRWAGTPWSVHDAPEVDVHHPLEILVRHRIDHRVQRHPALLKTTWIGPNSYTTRSAQACTARRSATSSNVQSPVRPPSRQAPRLLEPRLVRAGDRDPATFAASRTARARRFRTPPR